MIVWRRGWDSNPRYGCPYAAFRVRYNRPLCHLSDGVFIESCGLEQEWTALDRSLAPPYWEPARPALRTISPQRAISAAINPLSSSGGGDGTGRRPRLVSSRRTSGSP